jgi:hypothetical protein
MASSKRARCETESPIDAQLSTNGSGDPKKPKTANGRAGSSRKPRPPRNRAEEQELNRLDQKEYKGIMDRMVKSTSAPWSKEFAARSYFWDKFCKSCPPSGLNLDQYVKLTNFLDAMGPTDDCPERYRQSYHSNVRITIAERQKLCPWYFWGLEGHVRKLFPEAWPHVYEDGEDENATPDTQFLFPWDEPRATTSNSSGGVKGQDKKGLWDLPSNEMEKSIGDIEIQLSKMKVHTEKKKSAGIEVRKEAEAKIIAIRTEADAKIERIRAEYEKQIETLQFDISDFEETMKGKQEALEVRRSILAARKALDSYVSK